MDPSRISRFELIPFNKDLSSNNESLSDNSTTASDSESSATFDVQDSAHSDDSNLLVCAACSETVPICEATEQNGAHNTGFRCNLCERLYCSKDCAAREDFIHGLFCSHPLLPTNHVARAAYALFQDIRKPFLNLAMVRMDPFPEFMCHADGKWLVSIWRELHPIWEETSYNNFVRLKLDAQKPVTSTTQPFDFRFNDLEVIPMESLDNRTSSCLKAMVTEHKPALCVQIVVHCYYSGALLGHFWTVESMKRRFSDLITTVESSPTPGTQLHTKGLYALTFSKKLHDMGIVFGQY